MNISVNVSLKALQVAIFYTFSADRLYQNGALMLDPHTDENYFLWPVRNYTHDGLAPDTVFEFKIPRHECAGLGDPHTIMEFFRMKYVTFMLEFENATKEPQRLPFYSERKLQEFSQYVQDEQMKSLCSGDKRPLNVDALLINWKTANNY